MGNRNRLTRRTIDGSHERSLALSTARWVSVHHGFPINSENMSPPGHCHNNTTTVFDRLAPLGDHRRDALKHAAQLWPGRALPVPINFHATYAGVSFRSFSPLLLLRALSKSNFKLFVRKTFAAFEAKSDGKNDYSSIGHP